MKIEKKQIKPIKKDRFLFRLNPQDLIFVVESSDLQLKITFDKKESTQIKQLFKNL